MNKSFGYFVVGSGGLENLPFLEKDCRNYIDKARHLRLGKGGAGALREYFYRMQYKNLGFFALMDFDDDGRLMNVFWADPRSRATYQYFGDVVTFDTTYLMNRYEMPFAPVVGCMDGIASKAIIIDQDRAMKNVIAIVFPESRHRLCLWHILKKVPEKLSSYASYKSGMKNPLMKCVYDTQTGEEFEKSWDKLITTYNLHENVWLKSLYTERAYWVSAFLKDWFWTGMSTTQHSNSMNAFFDGYVHAKTNLKESPIEKRFQELYTNAKFRKVQVQLTSNIDLDAELIKRDGAVKTYLVEDKVRVEEFTKLVKFSVDFSEEDTDAKCSCGLFQMRGILCRYIFVCQLVQDKSATVIGGTQLRETVMQFGLDGSQPEQIGLDESQLIWGLYGLVSMADFVVCYGLVIDYPL
ncbi:protein FAR1-RELATED SEQUENCE 5-like [Juglans microcarpa x Juglans regia]|uniref:protein FAR1-RELATED SEQUENCE 5-like n=1 Tax=Juglans microcarpa x Juglans regia TaxID=2249226 RepID=UPI001B7F0BDC|nr:protein FAR1-RELATED SEQUENCE 5-like [Juglans microcarpa x Juglans regia]